MRIRRKILLGLLIIPVALALVSIVWPGTWFELVFLFLGVPVLVLNAWEFFSTETIGPFGGNPVGTSNTVVERRGSFMKSKFILAFLLFITASMSIIGVYAIIRSYVDRVPFAYALSIFLIKLGDKLWHFITIPAVFISILAFLLLWLFRNLILMALGKIKESKQVQFPDAFFPPVARPVSEDASQVNQTEPGILNVAENVSALEGSKMPGIDIKEIQLMLDLDGKEVTKSDLLTRVEALGIYSERIPSGMKKEQRELFYRGVVETLFGYILPMFGTVEMKNDGKVAFFALKAGLRERFVQKMQPVDNQPGSFDI
jgi:hypothetical protein